MSKPRPMVLVVAKNAERASNELAEGKITPEAGKAQAMLMREHINLVKANIEIAKMAGVPLVNSTPLLEVQ